MNAFRFASPEWLWVLPVVAWLVVRQWRSRRRPAVLYSSVQLVAGLPTTWAQRARQGLPWVRGLALVLLLLAAARPQFGLQQFRVRAEGIAIMMCVDRSGSMMALDFELDNRRADRLSVVKRVFRDFVQGGRGALRGRPDDQIGLISFGGFAVAQSPLTFDHGALLEVLKTVEIARPIRDAEGRVVNRRYLEEEQATAIGDAIALAVDRLKDAEAQSKVIILLSDGENTAGVVSPEAAAEAARTYGIRIYTIGAGSTGRVPFPEQDAFGRTVFVPRLVRLDEATLKKLAETTGGRYFHARDTAALAQVYEEIDRLEKTETEGRLFTEYRELYRWFLVPGLLLLSLELLLGCTWLRSLP